MTVTLKPKAEITVPKSIRRKAGIKPGDRFEFTVTGRVITIAPKLTPDEIQDERETRDPKIRATIRKGHEEYLAGKTRPIEHFLAKRAAASRKRAAGSQAHDAASFRRSHHVSLPAAPTKVHKANRDFAATKIIATAIPHEECHKLKVVRCHE